MLPHPGGVVADAPTSSLSRHAYNESHTDVYYRSGLLPGHLGVLTRSQRPALTSRDFNPRMVLLLTAMILNALRT